MYVLDYLTDLCTRTHSDVVDLDSNLFFLSPHQIRREVEWTEQRRDHKNRSSVTRWLFYLFNIKPFAALNVCPKLYKICQSMYKILPISVN